VRGWAEHPAQQQNVIERGEVAPDWISATNADPIVSSTANPAPAATPRTSPSARRRGRSVITSTTGTISLAASSMNRGQGGRRSR